MIIKLICINIEAEIKPFYVLEAYNHCVAMELYPVFR